MKKEKLIRLNLLTFALVFLFPFFSFASLPQAPSSFYLDELNMLDEKTKTNITQTNKELYQKTGSQVVVATIKNTTGLPASDLGPRIFNAWDIGDKTKQNGALILVTQDDLSDKREIYISTGYGIEGRLNDGKVGRIIDNFMLDDLKAGNYSEGINNGFNSIVAEIADEYGVELTGDYDYYLDTNSSSSSIGIVELFIILMVFIMISNMFVRVNTFSGPSTRYYRSYPRRRRYYGNPYTTFTRGSTYDPFDSFGGSSFSGGSSSSFGGSSSRSSGGFTGGGGKTGGGGAGRSF